MRPLTLQVYQDCAGLWRWRCLAGNGEQVAKSPKSYKSRDAITDDLAYILHKDFNADLYRDKCGEWRWRLRHEDTDGDGKKEHIVAITSEGYHNHIDCKHASDLLLDADIVEG